MQILLHLFCILKNSPLKIDLKYYCVSVDEDVMIRLNGEKWERQEHSLALSHQHITPQVILVYDWLLDLNTCL